MKTLLNAIEIRELDRKAIDEGGIRGEILMAAAGLGVAEQARAHVPPGSQIIVLCGGGNNGGDGFVAARALSCSGFAVHVFCCVAGDQIHGDALSAHDELISLSEVPVVYHCQGDPSSAASDSINDGQQSICLEAQKFAERLGGALPNAGLIIDAMLGTGLSNDLRAPYDSIVRMINADDTPVLSVDLPTGIDSDTGTVCGEAIFADWTLALAYPKRGHALFPGAAHAGELMVADIGIPSRFTDSLQASVCLLEPADGPGLLPMRTCDSHKGSFGHLVVWAGDLTTPGAALLTLSGALRAGVGLVTWAATKDTIAAAPYRPPEVMLRFLGNVPGRLPAQEELSKDATAMVIGPGLQCLRSNDGNPDGCPDAFVDFVSTAEIPVVLDAEALNLVARGGAGALGKRAVKRPLVLTPHPKEAARLLSTDVQSLQADRIGAARCLASKTSAIVVLKGAGTVVASPKGKAAVVGAGNPGMATGGTGDVLAGIIGAFLASALLPFDAACLGALLHACAGDEAAKKHGQTGLIASDLVQAMGTVLSGWNR